MSLGEVFARMNWSYLLELVLSVVPALVCIMIHEICHGAAAYALGDKTAARQGRLSLNPLRHIDITGLLMLVVFRLGWAKPVAVDPRNFKDPKRGMALTALAGPVSNFVLAALFLFLFGLLLPPLWDSDPGELVLNMLLSGAELSVGLGVFNLIPVPPLDGSKVLFSLLPDRQYMKLLRYERYGMILLVLLVAVGVLSRPLHFLTATVYNWLWPLAELGMRIAL